MNDNIKRVLHTLWQVIGGALISYVTVRHSSDGVQLTVTSAGATVLAAIKALLVS